MTIASRLVPSSAKAKTILHIEDDPIDQMAFRRRIASVWPHCRVTAADGRASAMVLLAENRFDAVVADYHLGDGTALDIFPRLGNMPIVITTGRGGESAAVKSLRSGAFDCLHKDLDGIYLEEIIGILKKAMEDPRSAARSGIVPDPQGKPYGKRLHIDSARLKEALDHHAVLAATDAAGNITYANEMFCRLSRYSEKELLGQNHRILKSGRHPPEFFRSMWEAISRGLVWRGEVCNLAKDGSEYWVDTTIVPFFNGDGSISEYLSIRTDITAWKNQNLELAKAKEEAEACTRAKARFLANMSHEIRTPLNGIVGGAEILAEMELPPEQREQLYTIGSCADSLLTVLNTILDYSKLDADRMVPERIPFRLESVVRSVPDLFGTAARAKGLDLQVACGPDAPPVLEGDPGRLKQILANLVGNALKFTEKGSIKVAFDFDADPARPDLGTLRVTVTDTGIGIPAEKQGSLFQEFSQADESTTRRFGGTGLGLVISRKLAELMGGSLSLESTAGEGTVFTLALACPVPDRVSRLPDPAATLAGARVLRLESGRLESSLIGEALLRMSMGVRSVPSLEMAAKALVEAAGDAPSGSLDGTPEEGRAFDFLLIEHTVPIAELEVWTAELRARGLARSCRMAIIANPGFRGDVARYKAAGFHVFLSRPILPDLVIQALALARFEAGLESEPMRASALITKHTLLESGYTQSEGLGGEALRFPRAYHILIADDSLVNRKILLRMARSFGCAVDSAVDGQEAVNLAAASRYDLILMDSQMPVMDGVTAATLIHAAQGHADRVPIILVTADALEGDRERYLKAGLDGYLSKPFKKETLFAAMAEFLPQE